MDDEEAQDVELAELTGMRMFTVMMDADGTIKWSGDESFGPSELGQIAWIVERLAQDMWRREREIAESDDDE